MNVNDQNRSGALKLSPQNIDLIVYDFDGVMTDNRALVSEDGTESVFVNRSDGLAIRLLKEKGLPQIILSTEANNVVTTRAKKLAIPVLHNISDKASVLRDYCRENDYALDRTVYIGNDMNDAAVMSLVGFPLAPADAYEAIRALAAITLKAKGGYGVIREFYDLLYRQH